MLGPDDPLTLDTVHCLGRLLHGQALWRHDPLCTERIREADALYRRALSGRDKVLGPDHQASLETAVAFAGFLTDQTRPDEAESLWQRILSARLQSLGNTHSSTADAAYSLGMILQNRRAHDKAAQAFSTALHAYRAIHGDTGLRQTEDGLFDWSDLHRDDPEPHQVVVDCVDVYNNCVKRRGF